MQCGPVRRRLPPGILLFGVWLTLALTGCATVKFDPTGPARILRRGIAEQAFPGCTVVVGTDRQVLWSGALGFQDYANRVRITRATMYDLASVTKVAGSTAVLMRLVALGKVRLSDPVAQYLPEFIAAAPTSEDRSQREQITVEHLLTHTSGLTAWRPFYKTVQGYADLLKAICATPLESRPGEALRYSDCGMILAGEVAARAGGRPLYELERELVFGPLGMKDTMRRPPSRWLDRIAPTELEAETGKVVHGEVHDENARAGGGLTGHAGLFATAEDLARLARELLLATEGRSKLFPQEVVEDFFRVRATARDSGRGAGWAIAHGDAGRLAQVVFHSGFTGTYIQLDLDRKWFVVLLTNRVHPSRDNDRLTAVRKEFLEAVSRQVKPPS